MPRVRDAIEQRRFGDYILSIYPDYDAESPREMSEGLGKMICFHRRYSLGDEHNYSDPRDFLTDTVRDSFSGFELYQKVIAGENDKLRITKEADEPDIWYLQYQRDGLWYTEGSFDEPIENMDEEFKDVFMDCASALYLRELITERGVLLPLYLYDHSGLSISTGSFIGRAVHAEWDSGQVGEFYCSNQDIIEAYGSLSDSTVEQATKYLEAEVEEYDHYLRGNCYGFVITDETGADLDSCWGFTGDWDDVKKWMKEQVSSEYEPLFEDSAEMLDEAEWGDDD